jgi:hypothetical protein
MRVRISVEIHVKSTIESYKGVIQILNAFQAVQMTIMSQATIVLQVLFHAQMVSTCTNLSRMIQVKTDVSNASLNAQLALERQFTTVLNVLKDISPSREQ